MYTLTDISIYISIYIVKLQPTFCLACSILLIFHFARFAGWGFRGLGVGLHRVSKQFRC